jgi:hypothetical protein
MWRTSKSAADSTGNRMPEDSWAARMLVDAARDGKCSAVLLQLEEQNWPPHVITRMGHASGCAALQVALLLLALLPAAVRLAALLPVGTEVCNVLQTPRSVSLATVGTKAWWRCDR